MAQFGGRIIRKALLAAASINLVFASWNTPEGGFEKRWLTLFHEDGEFFYVPVLAQSFFVTTPGTNFTITSDATWNNASNSVECIGAGASGGANGNASHHNTGGGGGAYSLISNFTFATPGTTTATARVGLGGSAVLASNGNDGGNSWFNSAADPGVGADNSKCSAEGGKAGSGNLSGNQSGGAGGATANGWGTTKLAGGRGGNLTGASGIGGSGGGAAAGPGGAGSNGGDSASTATTSTAGGNSTTATGGVAGANNPGGAGTDYDVTHGAGAGGAGFGTTGSNPTAGSGGNYGGGGGGANTNAASSAHSGAGASGLIVLTWTPGASTNRGFPLNFF